MLGTALRSRFLYAFLRIGTEILAFTIGSYLAFYLRFDGNIPAASLQFWRDVAPVFVSIRLAATFCVSRYRVDWRFTGMRDAGIIVAAATLGTAGILLFLSLIHHQTPRGVLLLEWILAIQMMVGVRLSARLAVRVWKNLHFRRKPSQGPVHRVLIIGAGDAGHLIVRSMQDDPAAGLLPVGFLDDDPAKWRLRILGVPVLGPITSLAEMVTAHKVEQVLVAIPSLPARRLKDIVDLAETTPARLTILPTMSDMLRGTAATRLIRNIKVEDLLERTPVRVDMEEIAGYLSGQRVLITGAGGSIGSELCRQIVALRPEQMILVGQGENSIFWIENELRQDYGFHAIPVIADIKDRAKLDEVFRRYQPTVVFHAAAHKHVPLMEANPEEALKNNIFGTRNVAELSVRHGVRKFVMISTDKAVNPSSVMGASKRAAEMVVQGLAQRIETHRKGRAGNTPFRLAGVTMENPVTELVSVRFGNVLGSRGSVIPLMQKQIEAGGPVTVTDPEMVRFFMTIPEAVHLVIQAGALGGNGRIFVLDMGKPCRIIDLARNLIRLSGFVPDRDIPIRITGRRPGEKLYEEVLTAEEGVTATSHDKIRVARATRLDLNALQIGLERLEALAQRGEGTAIRTALADLVPTYTGAPGLSVNPVTISEQPNDIAASLGLSESLVEETGIPVVRNA